VIKGTPIAICFLTNNKDHNNCLYLTDEYFIIKKKGKIHPYELKALKHLYWAHKQLLLPIVAGGLVASLSVFAYMNDLLHPWVLIFLFLGGVLSMYYGFIGSPALGISLQSHNEHYIIKENTIFLQEFIDFVNLYLTRKEAPCYFIEMDEAEWKEANELGYIKIEGARELLYEYANKTNKILLKIDFHQIKGTITYLQSGNNTLKPYITENIPLSAISIAG
jgi:hypothetical protein